MSARSGMLKYTSNEEKPYDLTQFENELTDSELVRRYRSMREIFFVLYSQHTTLCPLMPAFY